MARVTLANGMYVWSDKGLPNHIYVLSLSPSVHDCSCLCNVLHVVTHVCCCCAGLGDSPKQSAGFPVLRNPAWYIVIKNGKAVNVYRIYAMAMSKLVPATHQVCDHLYPDLQFHFPYSNSQPTYAEGSTSVSMPPAPSAPSSSASASTIISDNGNLTMPSAVNKELSSLLGMTAGDVQGGVLEAVCAELDSNYCLSDVGEPAHIDFSSVENMFGPAASQAQNAAGTVPNIQGSDASSKGMSHLLCIECISARAKYMYNEVSLQTEPATEGTTPTPIVQGNDSRHHPTNRTNAPVETSFCRMKRPSEPLLDHGKAVPMDEFLRNACCKYKR
jgi:hypothetical protein